MHLAESVQVVDVPVASLLAVFLTPELNPVWNERLVEQRLLTLNGQRLAFQVYSMPWPIADREFLIMCTDTEHASSHVYESSCKSIESDQLPVGEGRVRAHIHGAHWRFTAQGDRTLVRFQGSVDPMGPVPKWFIGGAQKFVSQSTIAGLVGAQRKLGLAPLTRFVHWGGDGTTTPHRADGSGACGRSKSLPGAAWCRRTAWCPFLRPCAEAHTPQPTPQPQPLHQPPVVLMVLMLCVGVALSAALSRRLNWQGLLRLVLFGRCTRPRRAKSGLDAQLLSGAPIRKVRSCIQMHRQRPPHDPLREPEHADLSELLCDLGGGGKVGAAGQLRRCSSHGHETLRRQPRR